MKPFLFLPNADRMGVRTDSDNVLRGMSKETCRLEPRACVLRLGGGSSEKERAVGDGGGGDEESGSDSGYTSDALENQFSLISFSGSFKAQGKAQKVKAQVKAELKATPEPHAMGKKKMKPTMGNGKNKSKDMGTTRTTRSRAKAQLADPGTFSNSDSDPVIKTHSLKRFTAL